MSQFFTLRSPEENYFAPQKQAETTSGPTWVQLKST